MKKMIKELALVIATTATTLVVLSGSALACQAGNNGNGCSWTCNGSVAQITCQNTAVTGQVPRCFAMDTSTGAPGTEVPCGSFSSATGNTGSTGTTANAASMLDGKTRGSTWLKKLAPPAPAPVKKAATKSVAR